VPVAVALNCSFNFFQHSIACRSVFDIQFDLS